MRPLPQSDGGYLFRLSGGATPGLAAGLHDVFTGFEDGIGEPVVAPDLPDLFDGVQRGAFWRQGEEGDSVWHAQPPTHDNPPDRGLAPPARHWRHGARFRPDWRHDQACRHAPRRADRTKDMGRDGSQVLWRRGPCAAPRRASCYPGLLPDRRVRHGPRTDGGFHGELLPPQLYGRFCARTRPDFLQPGGEVFLKSAIAPASCACCRGRADTRNWPAA